jgi:hypothetical protein
MDRVIEEQTEPMITMTEANEHAKTLTDRLVLRAKENDELKQAQV